MVFWLAQNIYLIMLFSYLGTGLAVACGVAVTMTEPALEATLYLFRDKFGIILNINFL